MKKIRFIFLLIVLALCVLVFVGCGEKTAITTFDFEEKLTEKGFNVNVSSSEESFCVISVAKNQNFEILFYEIIANENESSSNNESNVDISAEYAKKLFDSIKNEYDFREPTKLLNVEVTMPTYSYYSFVASDTFYIVSRVENTIMFTAVPSDNKESVALIFEELGYK